MSPRAQNNGELLMELHRSGWSPADLRRARDAYLLAMQLYSGIYTRSGKPTVTHEIGTASVARRHGAPVDVVLACLLHGAYVAGDFGHFRAAITGRKRAMVRRAIGDEAESYVHGFARTAWDRIDLAALAADVEKLGSVERNVCLVWLFEQLDHLLDYGAVLFFRQAEAVKARLGERRSHMCGLAENLGYPQLGAELAAAIDLTLATDLPAELLGLEFPGNSSSAIVPGSLRKRLLLHLVRGVGRPAMKVLRALLGWSPSGRYGVGTH
jgi:(p)ppGpp synthase/HD superfamily hydrolase